MGHAPCVASVPFLTSGISTDEVCLAASTHAGKVSIYAELTAISAVATCQGRISQRYVARKIGVAVSPLEASTKMAAADVTFSATVASLTPAAEDFRKDGR